MVECFRQDANSSPDLSDTLCSSDFASDDFDDLLSVLGAARVAQWLDNLQLTLIPKLQDADMKPSQLGVLAHDIVAKAGMLGFRGLAQSCSRLEQQILCNRELVELHSTRQEALRVNDAIHRLRGVLNADSSI